MEQWKISRAGIINFWYYDDEEFCFEDGRLLLRGANGSGKSVTMQSLIPLLFDGNKSPERLDPFGSRARKMESYLLSEGLDLDERIGYLYLEFEKKEAGKYISIGMGMRARKNMPLQSWYFIILDGRRLGKDYELPLYKDMGEKLPLTAKELENRIGSGGQFFNSQKEYKNAVNAHLFGYEDIAEFDELIGLLIQLRSPKLSKEFKPTTMYDIMQNSLQTLSDEDLRPMSEAIENMDEIKNKMETLQAAKKALQRIDTVYSKYNTLQLVNKADKWLKTVEEEQELNKALKSRKEHLQLSESEAQKLEAQLTALKNEESAMKENEKSLKEHDLSRLSEEKNILLKKNEESKKRLDEKDKHLTEQKRREREQYKQIKEKESRLSSHKKGLHAYLGEMDEISIDCQFDEHSFFKLEFLNHIEMEFNFQYHNSQCSKYKRQLKEVIKVLNEQERLTKIYENSLAELESAQKLKEVQQKKLKETEQLFIEMKDEYIEKLYSWNTHNDILKLSREVLSRSAERVYQFGDFYYYDQIIAPIREASEKILGKILSDRSILASQKASLSETLDEKQKELDKVIAQKDPEPMREEKILKNRERLKKLGIPFVPFYKAVDFVHDLDEGIRNKLEEALLDMGILDALIVPPEYEEKVLDMDEGMADKYIFANPEMLSFNLSEYLKAESIEEKIESSLIYDTLRSLFLTAGKNKTFIVENGLYGMGLIKGKISKGYTSKFIGYQSRKRYKQQLIDTLKLEVQQLKLSMNEIQLKIDEMDRKKESANQELDNFPKTADMMMAYQDFIRETNENMRMSQMVKEKEEISEKTYEQLKDKRIEVQNLTAKINLTARTDIYQDAVDQMEVYGNILMDLKLLHKDCINTRESLDYYKDQYENSIEIIENLTVDIIELKQSIENTHRRIVDIEGQLALEDYKEIARQLEHCLKRLDEIPRETREIIQKKAHLEAEIEMINEKIADLQQRYEDLQQILDIYHKGFKDEYKLGYVIKEQDEGIYAAAEKVLKVYGTLLEEKKQLQSIQYDLQEKLLKESGILAEYNMKRIDLFKEGYDEDEKLRDIPYELLRMDIVAKVSGREVKFYELFAIIENQIAENGALLDEEDRKLFEDILIKSVSRKISAKIYHSELWVKRINSLMEGMNTSSGLTFNLKWVTKKAESEDQLGTKELVELLKMDQGLLTAEQRTKLIKHFRSKIQESKNRIMDDTQYGSFLTLMKEILDYRKWFEFQLFYTKKGEARKEMTNNAFFTFSGGEKAMAMYVPLFSSVYAKYGGGKEDCPRIISLDEAFAGVDEKNIRDMFRLLIELDLSFIANSQVLFGDYDTVPALSIYELIRPENVTFVTGIRYKWNGFVRILVQAGGAASA